MKQSKFERVCMCIPIVGWMVAGMIEKAKLHPAESAILKQIRDRKAAPRSDWSTPDAKQIADRVARICQEQIGWPNSHFVPDDPFEIMIALRTGDLCEVEAIMALEEEFEIDFEKVEDDFLLKATFRDIVDWIKDQKPTKPCTSIS